MTSPSAKNGMTSYAYHFQRRKYVRDAYSRFRKDSSIDLWYGRQALYGKIDPAGRSVYLREENLTNFPSNPEVHAVNFVVDAFEDFRNFVIEGMGRGIYGNYNTFLYGLSAKKGYEDPQREQEKLLSLFGRRLYKGYIPKNNKDREIETVSDYVSVFYEFFSKVATSVPLTFTSLLQSFYISPLSSGLVVEINDLDHSEDQIKFEKFVSDPTFDLYQQSARKFGFKVDYNAPWRLVADVTTREMKHYMAAYGITTYSSLFREYYKRPVVSDLVTMKNFIFNSYNDFVEFNPYTKVPRISKNGQRTKFCVINRSEITPEEFNDLFDEIYWLKFYFRVRSMELGRKWTKGEVSKVFRRAEKIFKDLDLDASVRYIEGKLKKQARG